MENQLTAEPAQGEESKSKAQDVANVLEHNSKNNQFLQNVGLQAKRRPRVSGRDAATQLEAEKMENAELLSIISNQSKQLEEIEQARVRDKEERVRDKEEMSQKYADLEAKVELLLGRDWESLSWYAGWNQT